MEKREVTLPEPALTVGTRATLGAGTTLCSFQISSKKSAESGWMACDKPFL